MRKCWIYLCRNERAQKLIYSGYNIEKTKMWSEYLIAIKTGRFRKKRKNVWKEEVHLYLIMAAIVKNRQNIIED